MVIKNIILQEVGKKYTQKMVHDPHYVYVALRKQLFNELADMSEPDIRNACIRSAVYVGSSMKPLRRIGEHLGDAASYAFSGKIDPLRGNETKVSIKV